MANHSLPTTSSLYTAFVTEMGARFNDLALDLDSVATTPTNLPTNAIRWNATTYTWEKWSGTAWAARSSLYNININGTVGATTPNTGAFTTLSSSSTTALAAGTTIGGVTAVTTTGSQTLTNKTLTTPTISSIFNTGTLTLPTATDTLVGRATTDTLSNKTLTAPRIASGGFIADANGNEQIIFTTTANAVNEITITNSATGASPQLAASGGDTNISINLVSKGTGTVNVGGIPVVTTTGSQTLTNKILTSPTISSIVNTGTLTLPTATDTLVGRSTTDTLSNKTLTAPRFANGGFIADANGNEQIILNTTASAVNEITITNSAAGTAPQLASSGADLNIDLDLVAKGTGVVRANGIEVATISGAQTFIDKTWNGVTIGLAYGGTGATTAATARTNLDVPTRTGTDASGTWAISITGSAATLTTPRTINGTAFNGSAAITTTNWGTSRTITLGDTGKVVNGSANVTWTLMEIGAADKDDTVNLTGDQSISGVKTFSGLISSTGNITVTNATPLITLVESDQTAPAGRRRLVQEGNVFTLRRNTAAGGDFSTEVNDITSDDSGNFTALGNVTAYSDIRLKTDLAKITDALSKVKSLSGYTYTRIDSGERQTGLIAQEVQKVLPEAVITSDKYLSLAYGNLVGLLVEAIKDQAIFTDALEIRIRTLEGI